MFPVFALLFFSCFFRFLSFLFRVRVVISTTVSLIQIAGAIRMRESPLSSGKFLREWRRRVVAMRDIKRYRGVALENRRNTPQRRRYCYNCNVTSEKIILAFFRLCAFVRARARERACVFADAVEFATEIPTEYRRAFTRETVKKVGSARRACRASAVKRRGAFQRHEGTQFSFLRTLLKVSRLRRFTVGKKAGNNITP